MVSIYPKFSDYQLPKSLQGQFEFKNLDCARILDSQTETVIKMLFRCNLPANQDRGLLEELGFQPITHKISSSGISKYFSIPLIGGSIPGELIIMVVHYPQPARVGKTPFAFYKKVANHQPPNGKIIKGCE